MDERIRLKLEHLVNKLTKEGVTQVEKAALREGLNNAFTAYKVEVQELELEPEELWSVDGINSAVTEDAPE